jgi:hypothetical protein
VNYWIAVASREHVQKGKIGGFAQVCHGKQSPLHRMKPGDWIIYYSPTEQFGKKTSCRKFTAIGQIENKEPYQYKMSKDFIPWRRDVQFIPAQEVAIESLLDKLSFIKNKNHWGFIFRFGLFKIPKNDFDQIATAMGVTHE